MSNDTGALKRSLCLAVIAVIIALVTLVGASVAWYIYNTNAHTTKLEMAAGSTVSLLISKDYEGPYGSSAVLDSFSGRLRPVSTNKITNGFQTVDDFEETGATSGPALLAYLFKQAPASNYYKTSLYIKTSAQGTGLYLSDIGFEDTNPLKPISTAIRIGLVMHQPGQSTPVTSEMIFSISDEDNPEKEYNTKNGYEGCVLDSSKTDGSVVDFTPYTQAAYANYDTSTGAITLRQDGGGNTTSVKLADFTQANVPIQVDVYIWLEGCDEDCVKNLLGTTLSNIALSFVGL